MTACCRDRPSLPFRCLDPQYRRELVRVYLTNVEGICRRFVDEKRESLLRIKETAASFKAYWGSQSPNDKKALLQHKGSDMLKVTFNLRLALGMLVCSHVALANLAPKQARQFIAHMMSYLCVNVNRSIQAHACCLISSWTSEGIG